MNQWKPGFFVQGLLRALSIGIFYGSMAVSARAEWISLASPPGAGLPVGSAVQISVLEETHDRIVVRYQVSGLQLSQEVYQGEVFSRISIPGLNQTEEKGLPEVPRLGRNFTLPLQGDPVLRVLHLKTTELTVDRILPSKGSIRRSSDPKNIPYYFADFYSQGEIYPAKNFVLKSPFRMRKIRGVNLSFLPVQFDSRRNRLKVVYDATVEIRTASPTPRVGQSLGVKTPFLLQDRIDPGFSQLYRDGFVNFDHSRFFESTGEGSAQPHLIRDTGRVLVIAHSKFLPGLQPWVDWKRQTGLKVWVTDVAEAGSVPDEIASYIKKMYESSQIGYVILVGDEEFVPSHRGVHQFAFGQLADPMYSLVDGDDSYPDLIVSRISVETTAELDSVIRKIIQYEKEPRLDDGQWYSKALGIADEEGTPTDASHMDEIRELLTHWHYRDQVDHLYGTQVTASEVEAAVNEGRGLINYLGHGFEDRWTTSAFDIGAVNQLRNFGRFPVIVSAACFNGKFGERLSFAEAWLRANQDGQPTGAIAVLASSIDQSWIPPVVGQKAINRILTEEKITSIGALFFQGMIAMLEDGSPDAIETFETWHTFGDGTVSIRTRTPTSIQAEIPTHVQDGARQIHFPSLEKQTRVGVMQNGKMFGAGYSEAGGELTIDLEDSLRVTDGPVRVTLTGVDKIPRVVDLNFDVFR